jgi:predicted nucleotide-binding protein (sugar kinase/HSP70/actin superfamily)
VNNDACYPAIMAIGQILFALKSGAYDLDNTSVIMPQTGGGCRATNYVALLRKALLDAGFAEIPVLSFNLMGLDKQPGFQLSPFAIKRLLISVLYGDLLSQMVRRVRPYEKIKGSTNLLYQVWMQKCKKSLAKARFRDFKEDVRDIIGDFSFLRTNDGIKKPRVGIVGEIFVKYHPYANNDLENLLETEGVEVVVPGLMEFILYCSYDSVVSHQLVGGSFLKATAGKLFIRYIEKYRNEVNKFLEGSIRFSKLHDIESLAKTASEFLSLGNNRGEGWLMTSEMVTLLKEGVDNILLVQPFGCLPNHVLGKGMLKKIRKAFPDANMMPLDYDPGASEVNQLNRVKLLLSSAWDALEVTEEALTEKGS